MDIHSTLKVKEKGAETKPHPFSLVSLPLD
jgi:hypothetical protein